jgi:hypothetical protein
MTVVEVIAEVGSIEARGSQQRRSFRRHQFSAASGIATTVMAQTKVPKMELH